MRSVTSRVVISVCGLLVPLLALGSTVSDSAYGAWKFDSTFDGDGRQILRQPPFDGPPISSATVARQLPDGKILVLGGAGDGTGRSTAYVSRFLPDGQLDLAYGGGAFRPRKFFISGMPRFRTPADQFVSSAAVSVSPEGAALFAMDTQATVVASDGAVTPFRYQGFYNWEGPRVVPVATHALLDAYGTDRLADGRFIVAGTTAEPKRQDTGALAVARVLPGGEADTSFGGDGVVELPTLRGRDALVAATADGGAFVAAHRSGGSNVIRLRGDGSVDPGFGVGGRLKLSGRVSELLPASNGDLLAAGPCALRRFRPDGTPDLPFTSRAVAALRQPGTLSRAPLDVTPQPGGSWLVKGGDMGSPTRLVRLRADGSQDMDFGEGGSLGLQHEVSSPGGLVAAPSADGGLLVFGGSGPFRNNPRQAGLSVYRLRSGLPRSSTRADTIVRFAGEKASHARDVAATIVVLRPAWIEASLRLRTSSGVRTVAKTAFLSAARRYRDEPAYLVLPAPAGASREDLSIVVEATDMEGRRAPRVVIRDFPRPLSGFSYKHC